MTGFTVNYNKSIEGVAFNDLYLDASGGLAISSGRDEIIENCYHVLQLTVGDYGFNTNLGIPYNNYLSSNEPVGSQIKLSIIQSLEAVNGVVNVSYFNAIILNDRTLQIEVIINLIEGDPVTILI